MARAKPCPRCDGFEVTFDNWRNVDFCDKHLVEVLREIASRAPLDTAHNLG